MKRIISYLALAATAIIATSCGSEIKEINIRYPERWAADGYLNNSYGEGWPTDRFVMTFGKQQLQQWEWTFDEKMSSESYPTPCYVSKQHPDYIVPYGYENVGLFFTRDGKLAYRRWNVEKIAIGLADKDGDSHRPEILSPDLYLHAAELIEDYESNALNINDEDSNVREWVEYLLGLDDWNDKELANRLRNEVDDWRKAQGYIDQLIANHAESRWNDYLYGADRISDTDIRYIYVDNNGDYSHSLIRHFEQDEDFKVAPKFEIKNEGLDIHIGLNDNYKQLRGAEMGDINLNGQNTRVDNGMPEGETWDKVTEYQFAQAFDDDISVLQKEVSDAYQPALDEAMAKFGIENIGYTRYADRTVYDFDHFSLMGSTLYYDVRCRVVIDDGEVVSVDLAGGWGGISHHYEYDDPGLDTRDPQIYEADKIIKTVKFPSLHPKRKDTVAVVCFHTTMSTTLTREMIEKNLDTSGHGVEGSIEIRGDAETAVEAIEELDEL